VNHVAAFCLADRRNKAGLVGEREGSLNYISSMALIGVPRIDDFAASARRFARRN
jgi:hypothetical protein